MTDRAAFASEVSRREPELGHPSRAHAILLAGLTLLLTAALALQILPSSESAVVKRDAPLADYFPRDVAGWHGEDQALGDTEAQVGKVRKILNYDEAMMRVYRKGGQEFSVYVAYWRAGKMPAREIAFHVPDQCWVSVGWKQRAADYHYQREFEGRRLAPAQYREFDDPNGRQYVLYWHILNGRAIIYSTDGTPSQLTTLHALFRHGFSHKGEQYFIRIASRSALDELWNDEGFQEIMELVAPLGPGLDPHVERLAGAIHRLLPGRRLVGQDWAHLPPDLRELFRSACSWPAPADEHETKRRKAENRPVG